MWRCCGGNGEGHEGEAVIGPRPGKGHTGKRLYFPQNNERYMEDPKNKGIYRNPFPAFFGLSARNRGFSNSLGEAANKN